MSERIWPDDFINRIFCGDALDVLRTLPNAVVQCVVTSPPYWGLRDYKVDGQLGLERTPEEYIAKMVEVFREVQRVLRDDGTLWLNIGDSYATGAGKVGECPGGGPQGEAWKKHFGKATPGSALAMAGMTQPNRMPIPGMKPKDLVGIPWMLAFALRADGWYLRQDIVWAKPNPMPESVTDRCTKSHEYLFLLSKSGRYFYDAEAIKEPFADARNGNPGSYKWTYGEVGLQQKGGLHNGDGQVSGWNVDGSKKGRNRRSVWTLATEPFPEAHFATFPQKLVEPCILAGSRIGDIVLDPFFGSGTVGVVAGKLGRKWIGIDLKAEYCEMARARIARETAQLNMFFDNPTGARPGI